MRYSLFGLLLVLAGCSNDRAAKSTSPIRTESIVLGSNTERPPGEKLIYTRQEFETLVVGKSQQEVLEGVGQPDAKNANQWDYRNIIMDPISGKSDPLAAACWKDGKAERVDYK